MSILARSLFPALTVAIAMSALAEAQEVAAPAREAEAPRAVAGAAGDHLIELMQEEIRLREELAAKIRDGAPESELEALRGALDRLEGERRALGELEAPALGGPASDEAGRDAPSRPSRGRGLPLAWLVETLSGRYRIPLTATAIALLLRFIAGWRVRRWLASMREHSPRRETVDHDPRWRQAEDWTLRTVSVALLVGLLAVLVIEAELLSGTTVAILLALGLALLWIFRHLLEDAIAGLALLRAGAYQEGDMVDLADVSGVVEGASLLSTTLRDTDGSVHFIPHRLVRGVRNWTYDWARAVVDIAVKPDEDLDRIMSVLLDVGREVAQSPPFVEMILEEPRMLGIESVDPSQVVIRFFLKTVPRRRSMVKREVQRRVIRRFRELGIEAPLPAQRLHHKVEKPAGDRGGATG